MLKEAQSNIMIVGSGGREHSLGWKLADSPQSPKLFFAPGNGGTENLGTNLDIVDTNQIINWSRDNSINLIVVGPEVPLEQGIINEAKEAQIPAFGPTQKAARPETSKAWASQFMAKHSIPQPEFRIFNEYEEVILFIQNPSWPEIVIKASGLAAGKGVILPNNLQEAEAAIRQIMVERVFGEAGREIVIQERLSGPEVSVLAFSDGNTIVPLLPSQDHKRAYDQDQGPNTGGMGAYAPTPVMTPELLQQIQDTILQPTIDGMRQEGYLYQGVLYAGLMLTDNGPRVLEYNVRFGDPETQPLMMLLDTDLLPILYSCINGTLNKQEVKFRKGAAVCVILASQGYPAKYEKGRLIKGLNGVRNPDIQIFHAGTRVIEEQTVTNGGRVLGITAFGQNIAQACQIAYSIVRENGIHFEGMHYRTDIAYQALT